MVAENPSRSIVNPSKGSALTVMFVALQVPVTSSKSFEPPVHKWRSLHNGAPNVMFVGDM